MNILENRFLNRLLPKALWAAVVSLCAPADLAHSALGRHRDADWSLVDVASRISGTKCQRTIKVWRRTTLRPVPQRCGTAI